MDATEFVKLETETFRAFDTAVKESRFREADIKQAAIEFWERYGRLDVNDPMLKDREISTRLSLLIGAWHEMLEMDFDLKRADIFVMTEKHDLLEDINNEYAQKRFLGWEVADGQMNILTRRMPA